MTPRLVVEGTPTHRGGVWAGRGALVLAVLVVPALVPQLKLVTATDTAAWAVAVLGLNLIVGFAGQISLGHAAFVGVGAYTTVILAADHGWPLVATVPAAGVVSFVIGFVLGVPALRFRGLYLALLTLAVGVAFGPIVKRLESITNGTNGKGTTKQVRAPSWFGTTRQAERVWLYFVVVAIAVVTFALCASMVKGRVGRALEALRGDELAAQTFGINVRLIKMVMFGVSAGVTGVAGALLMLPAPFAGPDRFSLTMSLQLYTAVFVGGIGTFSGSVLGGAVIAWLPVLITGLGIDLNPSLIFGAALVAVTLFAPDGVMGTWQRWRRTMVQVVPRSPREHDPVLPDDEPIDVEVDLDVDPTRR